MLSIDLPSFSPEVICHTPSSFFSSVLAAASSPPGDRPTQRRDTPNKIASPQCVLIAYLHALNNGPDLGRLHRFSPDSAWRGSRRATPGTGGGGGFGGLDTQVLRCLATASVPPVAALLALPE